MSKLRLLSVAGIALTLVAFSSGCGRKIEVGPYPVTIDLGGGEIDPSSFIDDGSKTAFEGVIEQDLCLLPTEDELSTYLEQVGDLNLSGLVEISGMDLQTITLTATSGDFSAVTEIVLTYIPKPLGGVQPDGVELGRATSETGFGTSVVLTPTEDVDLLTLIQDNDANPSLSCPELQIYVKGDATDEVGTITWQAEANVNVYALLG